MCVLSQLEKVYAAYMKAPNQKPTRKEKLKALLEKHFPASMRNRAKRSAFKRGFNSGYQFGYQLAARKSIDSLNHYRTKYESAIAPKDGELNMDIMGILRTQPELLRLHADGKYYEYRRCALCFKRFWAEEQSVISGCCDAHELQVRTITGQHSLNHQGQTVEAPQLPSHDE